jgi:uncharacterized protein YjbI with pentapeptide repeats
MALGMPWRTEPEIDAERQRFLGERRAVTPDMEHGIYPFRDESGAIQLTRADVEWLLATHSSRGRWGPVWWNEERDKPDTMRRLGLDLRGADLRQVDLSRLPLARLLGGLSGDELARVVPSQWDAAAIRLQGADLSRTHLEWAQFNGAHLESAILRYALLDYARCEAAHFEGASLQSASLQAARLVDTHLEGAGLQAAFFDRATHLEGVRLVDAPHGSVHVANLRWGEVNVASVDWGQLAALGDELWARRTQTADRKLKDAATRLQQVRDAVAATRQVATLLRSQGLNEDADRFAYRAQVLQRHVLRRQRKLGRAFGSWLLDVVSGYGYKAMRSVIAYVLIISLFAGAYVLNAQFAAPHLSWDEALVLSISSFHGRGFFTSGISLGDTLARLAAGEAIIGLMIEITFIATFTQRFFAR